jgi:hypothetical protein
MAGSTADNYFQEQITTESVMEVTTRFLVIADVDICVVQVKHSLNMYSEFLTMHPSLMHAVTLASGSPDAQMGRPAHLVL